VTPTFGTGNNFKHIHIDAVCNYLKSTALLAFCYFSGCNTTSSFLEKSKKSAWEAWKLFPDITFVHSFILQ